MPLIPRRRRPRISKPTPARQQTGTSYTTKGATGVKPADFKEHGSAQASKLFDRVPDVGTGITASQTYKRMVRDDASVRVSLRAGKAPVLGAEFFIDAFDTTPENLLIWDFVAFNIFSGLTSPWSILLERILRMYESARANSVFELVWENREWAPKRSVPGANRKQYTMLRKLAYRPDTTIQEFTYDNNGGPTGIVQQALSSDGSTTEVKIPIEKLIIFTLNEDEGDIEGMPMLRSAYKHWWYKNRFYNIDAIQKERHGIGVPDVEVGPGASNEDWALAKELGKNLRTNEFAHIVRPPSIKVGFAEVHGNIVDVLKSADHHDTMIMKNLMVQFLNMGTTSEGGGSRAAGASQMDMFMKAMRHVANKICDAINLYVIPPLVAYNFQTDTFPQMKVRNVGEAKDLQMWASAMRNLIDVGAITCDEETEAWIRDQLDMPKLQTPWKPLTERPARVQELIQAAVKQGGVQLDSNGQPLQLQPPTNGKTTISGERGPAGGNIGKSPSSGAV